MTELVLDGVGSVDLDPKEFVYELPVPFGRDRGTAEFRIKGVPASRFNVEYKAKIETIMHRTKVREAKRNRLYEQNSNADRLVRSQQGDIERSMRELFEAFYDNCIVEWSTTIQSKGKDLEPTKENWIALQFFNDDNIDFLFDNIRNDLNDMSELSEQAEIDSEDKEMENSKPPNCLFANRRRDKSNCSTC